MCKCLSNTDRLGASPNLSRKLFCCLTTLMVKKCFTRSSPNLPSAALSYSHMSYHRIPGEELSASLSTSLPQAAAPHRTCFQPHHQLCCSPLEAPECLNSLTLWDPEVHTALQVRLHRCWIQWDNHLFLLAVLCLMHPRVWSALLAARTHSCLTLRLPLASTPRPFSAGLLSSHSSPR